MARIHSHIADAARMNIGTLAASSGLSPKAIRYYERIGLTPPATRSPNGYRTYTAHDLQILRFIERAGRLGFSIGDIRSLLSLWADKSRASGDVKALALRQINRIDRKVTELESLKRGLADLVRSDHGDRRLNWSAMERIGDERDGPAAAESHPTTDKIGRA